MKSYSKIFNIGLRHIKKWVIDDDHIAGVFCIVFYFLCVSYLLVKCNDRTNNGVITVGVVYKLHEGRYYENWCEFYVEGKRYFSKASRGLSNIMVGDSVYIEYERNNPNNNAIVGYFEYALDRSKLPDTVFYRRPMDQMRRPLEY